jgi:HEAT repeats
VLVNIATCLSASLLILSPPVLLAAQHPPVGIIDFYGLRTVPEAGLRAALQMKEGDLLRAPGEEIVRRLEAVPGVRRAALDAVCCEEGKTILYVGIEEDASPVRPVEYLPAPTGTAVLPPDVIGAGLAFDSAFQQAVQAGDFEEDVSQGHSLMHFPRARGIQLGFVRLATRYASELKAVLREGSDPEQRALAAWVIAYAPDKKEIVPELERAVRDPEQSVRNNAMRALGLIAGYAQRHPDQGISVSAGPMVDLLNSLHWTDRNKSSLALMQISESGDAALLRDLRDRALPALVEMARWKSPGHFLAPLVLLGRMGGVPDGEIFAAWQRRDREPVIQAALGPSR